MYCGKCSKMNENICVICELHKMKINDIVIKEQDVTPRRRYLYDMLSWSA